MAVLFCLGMLAYYMVFLRRGLGAGSEPARMLWLVYFSLGCSAVIVAVTGVLEPLFSPNYPAVAFLLLCILIGITGFLGFRSRAVGDVIAMVRGQALIEAVLIAMQGFAIAFFLPFAISSLTGDANVNRLELSSKVEILGSYGLVNTIAGMGSHLFAASLVMAFIRLCQPPGEGYNLPRAVVLMLASLSYVIYVLAYVGRDGSIYWLMTGLMIFLIFRSHLSVALRRRMTIVGASICGLVLLPIVVITFARFNDSDFGVGGSLFEYFGAQIHHFSDYSSIDRPRTYGAMNFPQIIRPYCAVFGGLGCEKWEDLKPFVFDQYFVQGKAPWLFGTYVSDFVADFGYLGTLGLLSAFAFVCHRTCVGRNRRGEFSLARLLLMILCFLTPYWGVFYFRFGIINSFILINMLFVGFVWLVQNAASPGLADRRSTYGSNGTAGSNARGETASSRMVG